MSSRNSREGLYAGKRSGKHDRTWVHRKELLSIQVRPLNRKQRKAERLTNRDEQGEM